MLLKTGTSLGRYTIVEHLASGGMGVIYRARHQSLEQPVAVKVLASNMGADPHLRERFKQEALTQSHLIHPHIVRVIDFIEAPEAAIVMELVEGPSLDRLIDAERPGAWSVEDASALMTPLLEAMAFAHRRGVIHRDLKPENILIDTSGDRLTPKISDFGIAKVLHSGAAMTRQGSVMGTRPFMSPEQFRGALEVDPRADVFALGMIFWHLLTGRLPVNPTDMVAVANLYTGQTPIEALQALRPDVPEELAQAIHQALALDPGRRTPNVDALLHVVAPSISSATYRVSGEYTSRGAPNTLPPMLTPSPSPGVVRSPTVLLTPAQGDAAALPCKTQIEVVAEVNPDVVKEALAQRGHEDFGSLQEYQAFISSVAQTPDPSPVAAKRIEPAWKRWLTPVTLAWAGGAALVSLALLAGLWTTLTGDSADPPSSPQAAPSEVAAVVSSPPPEKGEGGEAAASLPDKLLPDKRRRRFKRGNPMKAQRLLSGAREALAQEQPSEAVVEALTSAIEVDPSALEARLLLAQTLSGAGRAQEALRGPITDLFLMESQEARQALLGLEADPSMSALWGTPTLKAMLDDAAHHELLNVRKLALSDCAGWSARDGTLACTWHCSSERFEPRHMMVLLSPDASAAPRPFDLGAQHAASRDRDALKRAQREAVLALSRTRIAPRPLPTWSLKRGQEQPLHHGYTVLWDREQFIVKGPDGAQKRLQSGDEAWRGCAQELGASELVRVRASLHAAAGAVVILMDHARYYDEDGEPREEDEPLNEHWSRFAVVWLR